MAAPDAAKIFSDCGFWRARALLSATRLDLFTALDGRRLTAPALARRLGCDARATETLLTALAELGYVERRGTRFANSALAAHHLVRGGDADLTAVLLDGDASWGAWGGLTAAVRRGRRARGVALYDDAARLRLLSRAGDAIARLGAADAVAAQVDRGGAAKLLDLAGGSGAFAAAFCRAWPGLRATLLDRPAALGVARAALGRHRPRLPIKLIAGDYLRSPLGGPYDVVFVSQVLHGEPARACQALLARVRRALARGGRIVVRDLFLDDDGASRRGAGLLGLAMLLYSDGGRMHRARDVGRWLRAAGFRRVRTLEAGTLIEATA